MEAGDTGLEEPMTFKWTYIAAGLLTVAAIVVSLPIDGGFWGAVSRSRWRGTA